MAIYRKMFPASKVCSWCKHQHRSIFSIRKRRLHYLGGQRSPEENCDVSEEQIFDKSADFKWPLTTDPSVFINSGEYVTEPSKTVKERLAPLLTIKDLELYNSEKDLYVQELGERIKLEKETLESAADVSPTKHETLVDDLLELKRRRVHESNLTFGAYNSSHCRSFNRLGYEWAEGVENIDGFDLTENFITHSTQQSYDAVLQNHLTAAVSAGDLDEAHDQLTAAVLQRYSGALKSNVYSEGPFNAVISGHARQGNFEKCCELVNQMGLIRIPPTSETFVYLLLSVINSADFDNNLRHLKSLAARHNIIRAHILQSSRVLFKSDQQQIAEKLQLIFPNENLEVNKSGQRYINPLVVALNDHQGPFLNSVAGLISVEESEFLAQKQLNDEKITYLKIKSIQTDVLTSKTRIMRDRWAALLDDWRITAKRELQKILRTETKNQKERLYMNTAAAMYFFRSIPIDDLVEIVVAEAERIVQEAEYIPPSLYTVNVRVGCAVENHYKAHFLAKHGSSAEIVKVYTEYMKKLFTEDELDVPHRELFEQLDTSQSNLSITYSVRGFSNPLVTKIGSMLSEVYYHFTFSSSALNVEMSSRQKQKPLYGFYTVVRPAANNSLIRQLKTHPMLVLLSRQSQTGSLVYSCGELPSRNPPVPWVYGNYGVNLQTEVPLMRFMNKIELEQPNDERLRPALDAINYLAACPWLVNEPIHQLIVTVFNNGGSEKLGVPIDPDLIVVPKYIPSASQKMTSEELREHKETMEAAMEKKKECLSTRFSMLLALSAGNYIKGGAFFLGLNMDFRGRVYPCAPHFQHMSGDPIRSCFLFAQGKKLGSRGLEWLKIHLVNLTELKKREPTDVRLKFADELIPLAIQSAKEPLKGDQWWKQFEKKWQLLSCCMELKNALELVDPDEYVSRLPIHQDGSCNGLQHYAALGRDALGARSVNVAPNKIPQDVYSDIAELVEAKRKSDAENGNDIAQQLEGLVTRKVVKQPVMTTVYGVTHFGMKEQIHERLREMNPDWRGLKLTYCSNYLALILKQCLNSMFTASTDIQDWLVFVAEVLSSNYSSPVSWQTPLDIPVYQPYFKNSRTESKNYNYGRDVFSQKPDRVKQMNGLPPNFIHSLDSTHMLLTALHCQAAGIQFAAIHDCYWTHAADVDRMNRICREQFVAMYKTPILQNFIEHIRNKHRTNENNPASKKLDVVLSMTPSKGDFNLDSVLDSTYFFS